MFTKEIKDLLDRANKCLRGDINLELYLDNSGTIFEGYGVIFNFTSKEEFITKINLLINGELYDDEDDLPY